MSYAEYHARDWAEGRTTAELEAEIPRVDRKIEHTYQWNEVGNANNDYVRLVTLRNIYEARRL